MAISIKVILFSILAFDIYYLLEFVNEHKRAKTDKIENQSQEQKDAIENYKLDVVRRNIIRMTDRNFEIFCSQLFRMKGYRKIILTKSTNDGGKDIILKDGGEITYVECKHFDKKNKVGRPIAQKLYGAMTGDGVGSGIIVTTSTATNECFTWCKKVGITIMEMDDIMNVVKDIGVESFI